VLAAKTSLVVKESQITKGAVTRNGDQPACKFALSLVKSADAVPDSKKRFLCGIFGDGTVVECPKNRVNQFKVTVV
jgi:hypothetical protein